MRRMAFSMRSMSAARDLAGGVPLVLDDAQRRLGRLEVGDGQDRLGLGEQVLLDGEVAAELLVLLGRDDLVLGREEARPGRP